MSPLLALLLAVVAAPAPPALRVDARVRTGVQPKSVSLAPDAQHLAVCNFGQAHDRNVVLLRPDDLAELAAVDFEGTATESAWRSADELLVSDFRNGALVTIDVPTATVVGTIRVGQNPKGIAISADHRTAFVTNWTGQSVSVVDLQTQRTVDTLAVGRRPRGVTIDARGELVVGAMWDHRIEALPTEGEDGAPTRTQRVCSYPRDVRYSPDEAWLVISCSGNRRVRWFDAQSWRLVGQAMVGENPRSLAITADGGWAAVANYYGDSVSLIDLRHGQATTSKVPDTDGIVGIAIGHGLAPVVFATSFGTREVIRLVAADRTPPPDPLGERRLRGR